VVRERFIRTHGPSGGLNAYSSFETSLGNRYSDADFDYRRCAAAADDARMASYVSEAGLMDLVQSMPDEDRLNVCAAEPRYARSWAPAQPPIYAERVAEAAPPPPAPMVEKAAEPVQVAQADQEWPDLAPVEPEGPARAVDPNEAGAAEAKPAELVQVAEVKSVDRVQAVRDAAKALREALAALEAEEVAAK
jgi:hypothetical protein